MYDNLTDVVIETPRESQGAQSPRISRTCVRHLVGAIVFFVVGVDLGSLSGTILVVAVYMWAPAVAAILIQRWDEQS